MSKSAQYVVDAATWIGRELKAKGDKVMLTSEQAKYVPVTLDPKWKAPADESETNDTQTDDTGEQQTPAKDTAKK